MQERLRIGGCLGGLLGLLLQAGVIAAGVFLLELLNSAGRINIFELAGIKRMAIAANVDLQFLTRTTRRKRMATTARDLRFIIFRMNIFFHGCDPRAGLRNVSISNWGVRISCAPAMQELP